MLARKSILLVACLGAAACSPFDPDLGPTPYLCGAATEAARCPSGYACMSDGAREVCVLEGMVPPDARPDSVVGGFHCAMDGMLEPNDMVNQAYQTDVGIGAPSRQFGPISVCPEGDKDHYQISLTTALKGIEVITRWDAGSAVSCSLLNSAGTSIGNCTPNGTRVLRVCVPNLPTNNYYAVAYSAEGQKNNYRIEMKVVDNCAQP